MSKRADRTRRERDGFEDMLRVSQQVVATLRDREQRTREALAGLVREVEKTPGVVSRFGPGNAAMAAARAALGEKEAIP